MVLCVNPCLWSTRTASPLVSTDLQGGAASASLLGLEQLLGLRALQPKTSSLGHQEREVPWVSKSTKFSHALRTYQKLSICPSVGTLYVENNTGIYNLTFSSALLSSPERKKSPHTDINQFLKPRLAINLNENKRNRHFLCRLMLLRFLQALGSLGIIGSDRSFFRLLEGFALAWELQAVSGPWGLVQPWSWGGSCNSLAGWWNLHQLLVELYLLGKCFNL